jgi:hypothetical protein
MIWKEHLAQPISLTEEETDTQRGASKAKVYTASSNSLCNSMARAYNSIRPGDKDKNWPSILAWIHLSWLFITAC